MDPVRKVLQSLLRLDYRIARSYGLARLHFAALRSQDRAPVIVHQMGKVGSSSVTNALRTADPRRLVYHVHHLTGDSVKCEEELYRRAFPTRRRIDPHLLNSLYLLPKIEQGDRKWNVVTLTRDPLARNLSAFFQTVRFIIPDFPKKVETVNSDILADEIQSRFFEDGWWHHDPFDYFFNQQLRPAFGIDVFKHEFPKAQGYAILNEERVRLLLIRLEDLNCVATCAFREFLGIENLELLRKKQVGDEKYYASVYRLVRATIRFPVEYLDRIYDSPYTHYFYSGQEIQSFRSTWRVA